MVKWLLIGFLTLAAAEIATFALAGRIMGLPEALALLFAASLAGVIVLRCPGRARLERLRAGVTQSGLVGLAAAGDAFITVSAGILLLLPGFITDLAGIFLLLPPVRRWIGDGFRRFARTSQATAATAPENDRSDSSRAPRQAHDDPLRINDPP